MNPVRIIASVLLMTLALPAAADDADFPEYSGNEFQALYEYAMANTLPNLEGPDDAPAITGDTDLDERIWELAFARGYVLRPTARGGLPAVGGVRMQPQAAEAWTGLRAEARAAGMGFIVSSAYRSPEAQRSQFLSKLDGTTDAAIDAALTWWSVPGASKHHGGYALDFRYSSGTFGEFRQTPDYAWLKDGNFQIPKKYGLIPSYPDDGVGQGPNPEPWEFVWVGVGLIRCGPPQQSSGHIAGPARAILTDIEACPGGAGPISVPVWLTS